MKTKFLLYFLFLSKVFLFSSTRTDEDPSLLMQNGEALVEVHLFEQAIKNYDSLLDLPLKPWQKAIVHYNHSYVFLQQENWLAALEELNEIATRQNLSPLLKFQIQQNISTALLGQAQTLLYQEQDDESLHSSLDLILFSLIKESLKAANEAEKQYCNLRELEGFDSCSSEESINILKRKGKEELALLLEKKMTYNWKHLSLDETLNLLQDHVNRMFSQLRAWNSSKTVKPPLSSLISGYHEKKQLWKHLEILLDHSEEKQKILFHRAESFYSQALASMKTDNIKNSLNMISDSQKTLLSLRELLPKPTPLVASIQKVIANLNDLVEEDPMQEASLNLLSRDLDFIMSLTELSVENEENKSKMLKLLKSSNRWLNMAKNSLTNHPTLHAAVFLTAVQHILKKLLVMIHQQENEDPELILSQAITEQRNALDLTLLSHQLSSHEVVSDDLNSLLKDNQKEVGLVALLFPNSVIQTQKSRFKAENSTVTCQKKPWNVVMPLYFDGFQTASDAENHLQNPQTPLAMILDDQKETLRKWEMALRELKKNQKNSSKEEKNENPKSQTDHTQIMQDLREMDAEDQQRSSTKQLILQEVEKPW